jgi:hypothetical protein
MRGQQQYLYMALRTALGAMHHSSQQQHPREYGGAVVVLSGGEGLRAGAPTVNHVQQVFDVDHTVAVCVACT